MVSARDNLLHAWRTGSEPHPRDVCATITTEVELQSYVEGLKARGVYDNEAAHAVETRRFQLQRDKGVSWR